MCAGKISGLALGMFGETRAQLLGAKALDERAPLRKSTKDHRRLGPVVSRLAHKMDFLLYLA